MTDRLDTIRAMRTSTDPRYTLAQIGDTVGVTRERVRQLCVKHDIVQPAPEPYVLPACIVCGEPYVPCTARRRSTMEGMRDHQIRTGHNPLPKKAPPEWAPNARQVRIIDMRQQGMTIAGIAHKLGTSSVIVQVTLQRAGLAGSYHAERDCAIIADWQSGLTYKGLAVKYNLSYARIRLILAAFIGSGEMPYGAKRWTEK
jgi:phage shock protein PspC (stress-responsive transcriptional regulator)